MIIILSSLFYPASPRPKSPSKSKKAALKKASPPPPPKAKEEPFDNSKYRAADMYDYNPMSFYDMEIDMMDSRLPQQNCLN